MTEHRLAGRDLPTGVAALANEAEDAASHGRIGYGRVGRFSPLLLGVLMLIALGAIWWVQREAPAANPAPGGLVGAPAPDVTLTLLDGQRVVPANVTGIPDISQFPQLLVTRVDVVTGGASASYGSDAVGGVVNFITEKHFEGFKAQAQGGIIDGLGHAFYSEVTIDRGRAVEGNFDRYRLIRHREAPASIDVHVISSVMRPTGFGEIAVPVIAPAVANAIAAATGLRLRRTPFARAGFTLG